MAINSWELFLKAKILKNTNDKQNIYYKDSDKTICISKSINKLYDEKSAIRLNLETMVELRDKATHLLIEELRPDLSRIFQSNIINYIDEFEDFTKIKIFENNNNSGMLSLVIPGDNNIKEINKIYGEETENEVKMFLQKIHQIDNELKSNHFMTDISYSIYLEKKKEKADLTLSVGNDGEITTFIKVPTNPSETHPYKFSELLAKLRVIMPDMNSFHLIEIRKKYKIKDKLNYYYCLDSLQLYSEECFQYIENLCKSNKNLLTDLKKKKN